MGAQEQREASRVVLRAQGLLVADGERLRRPQESVPKASERWQREAEGAGHMSVWHWLTQSDRLVIIAFGIVEIALISAAIWSGIAFDRRMNG
jgi:hypothetical protein